MRQAGASHITHHTSCIPRREAPWEGGTQGGRHPGREAPKEGGTEGGRHPRREAPREGGTLGGTQGVTHDTHPGGRTTGERLINWMELPALPNVKYVLVGDVTGGIPPWNCHVVVPQVRPPDVPAERGVVAIVFQALEAPGPTLSNMIPVRSDPGMVGLVWLT